MQECGLVFQMGGRPMEAPGEWAQVPGQQKEACYVAVCVCVRMHVFELCGWWGEGPVGRGPASFPTPAIQPARPQVHTLTRSRALKTQFHVPIHKYLFKSGY